MPKFDDSCYYSELMRGVGSRRQRKKNSLHFSLSRFPTLLRYYTIDIFFGIILVMVKIPLYMYKLPLPSSASSTKLRAAVYLSAFSCLPFFVQSALDPLHLVRGFYVNSTKKMRSTNSIMATHNRRGLAATSKLPLN